MGCVLTTVGSKTELGCAEVFAGERRELENMIWRGTGVGRRS